MVGSAPTKNNGEGLLPLPSYLFTGNPLFQRPSSTLSPPPPPPTPHIKEELGASPATSGSSGLPLVLSPDPLVMGGTSPELVVGVSRWAGTALASSPLSFPSPSPLDPFNPYFFQEQQL